MIVSASRRTDIPAFYSEWLMNRLREGYALVQNPGNPHRFSRVRLDPQAVDCIVFWTKDPAPILPKLGEISAMGYPFYFQFTLTPYGRDLEPNLPPKADLMRTFQRLGEALGPERVVWRYDPVVFTDRMDIAYHLRCFEKMAALLEGSTRRCIFSFLDLYPGVRRALRGIPVREIREEDMRRIAEGFSETARKHRLRLFTCCEPADLGRYGAAYASCIDASMIEDILGCPVRFKRDAGQRPGCGCMQSVDIGAYDCCPHGCRYCYAASSPGAVRKNAAAHDPKSPLLFGTLPEDAAVAERNAATVKDMQMRLL